MPNGRAGERRVGCSGAQRVMTPASASASDPPSPTSSLLTVAAESSDVGGVRSLGYPPSIVVPEGMVPLEADTAELAVDEPQLSSEVQGSAVVPECIVPEGVVSECVVPECVVLSEVDPVEAAVVLVSGPVAVHGTAIA